MRETKEHVERWINQCLSDLMDAYILDNYNEQTVESAFKLLSYVKKMVNEEYVEEENNDK